MEFARRAGVAAAALALIVTATPCRAQNPQGYTAKSDTRGQIELTRADVQNKRREIVQKLMELTPEESQAFWPVYREYQAETAKVGDQRVTLIENYLKNSASMTDKQAEDLLKDWFKVRESQLGLQKKYVGKFRKVLPAVKVARLYQIENALDAVISANLQANMPMVGDTTTQ
jgi:hypothetical protein